MCALARTCRQRSRNRGNICLYGQAGSGSTSPGSWLAIPRPPSSPSSGAKGSPSSGLRRRRGLPNLSETTRSRPSASRLEDKAVFARQFATMINSGLAVLRALSRAGRANGEPETAPRSSAPCAEDVEAGHAPSDAMAKHPVAFDRLYVAMVRAGEAGGALDQTLNRLANS